MARIHHADLRGLRDGKYRWLDAHDLHATPWQDIEPTAGFYLFVPRDERLAERYEAFPSVPDLFPLHSVGIVTARDRLTIHWSPDDAWRTVTAFCRMDPDLARKGYKLGKDAKDWKVALAQKDLLDSGPHRESVVPILYRPFDLRYTYYTGKSSGFHCRPRPEVMRHMLQENLALMTCRQLAKPGWAHALVTQRTTDDCMVSNRTRERGYLMPLYVYPSLDRGDLFAHLEPTERQPNLHPNLVAVLAALYREAPTPEAIFHYVYGVLYAPTYRERYAEFLRIDFPRVPFTADAGLFAEVAARGERLTALHLLRSAELDPPAARFEGDGDGVVAKGRKAGLRYDPDEQRVYINAGQHFAPVPQAVWDYRVGGYQVCEKWLKDRRERRLGLDDIKTYCRIVTALGLTIGIQAELDALYPGIEDSLLDIDLS